jgi:hypothetical protein
MAAIGAGSVVTKKTFLTEVLFWCREIQSDPEIKCLKIS